MSRDSEDRRLAVLLQHPVLWLSLVLFAGVLPFRPEMASWVNLEVLLMSMTLLAILALGQSFVLITAGIDLSVPAVMSLVSVIGASLLTEGGLLHGAPAMAAAVVMLALGVTTGAVQGAAVALLRMPAFLVSLSSLIFLSGAAVWYTHSDRTAVPPDFVELWYARWAGIPIPLLVVAALVVLAHLVLEYTVFGRHLYAVGHNLQAAVISGVPATRTIVLAYMISGGCAALAGVFYTARLHTGSPQLVETEVLLDCIAAAVIGGVSLFGGVGHVGGVLRGVLFIALVGNSLNMLGLRYWHVIMVKGGVILLAALLDTVRNRWLAERE